MKKLISKLKHPDRSPTHSQPSLSPQEKPHPSTIQAPNPTDVFRYRYHHGVNLGSVFVLERWLSGAMFPGSAGGGSEHDAVTASIKEHGVEETKRKWEEHWKGTVNDGDWEWLAKEGKGTSIRLPVGWWMMGDLRETCRGTEWEGLESVYSGAWAAAKALINQAKSHGIGVLIDLHGLPGGANDQEHSGTSKCKSSFWGSKKNLSLALDALRFVAVEARDLQNVVGIQIVNEACHNPKGMHEFYDHAINAIGEVDQSIPIYISDAWNLGDALKWVTKKNMWSGHWMPTNPIVIDTHKYYTFSDEDRRQSPQQIIARVGGELGELDGKEGSLADRGEAQVIIGEWSCVLDGQTWSRVEPQEKDPLVTQFGHNQSQKWAQRAGGSYFWTWKMDWMDGGEWGFVEQIKKGNIHIPGHLTLPVDEISSRASNAQDRRADLGSAAKGAHEGYWNKTSPGQHFEHWLYAEGWEAGFSDALAFFTMRSHGRLGGNVRGEGGDRIGCLEIWTKKRLLESGRRGQFKWEWEQGFRAGVAAFEKVVEI